MRHNMCTVKILYNDEVVDSLQPLHKRHFSEIELILGGRPALSYLKTC